MTLTLIAPNGEKHGLINSVANSVADNGFKHMKPEVKAKAEKLKKEESRMIKARYLNKNGRNERLTKPYCHWAGDPIETWHFIPGEVYTLPLGLVNEVNDPKKRQLKRSELLDAEGKPTLKDEYEDPLHQFVPVEF